MYFINKVMSRRITLSASINHYIGNICFIERCVGSGDLFVLAVIIVGPYDLEFRNVALECENMYRNVSDYVFT